SFPLLRSPVESSTWVPLTKTCMRSMLQGEERSGRRRLEIASIPRLLLSMASSMSVRMIITSMPLMLPDVAPDRVRRSGWVRLGGAVKSSPTVANGVVYVGSDDDKLYAFNAAGCGAGSC